MPCCRCAPGIPSHIWCKEGEGEKKKKRVGKVASPMRRERRQPQTPDSCLDFPHSTEANSFSPHHSLHLFPPTAASTSHTAELRCVCSSRSPLPPRLSLPPPHHHHHLVILLLIRRLPPITRTFPAPLLYLPPQTGSLLYLSPTASLQSLASASASASVLRLTRLSPPSRRPSPSPRSRSSQGRGRSLHWMLLCRCRRVVT